jgi:hypothetical protein
MTNRPHAPTSDAATSHCLAGRPLTCTDAVELLPWLLNGSLDENERERVVAHVAGCPSCQCELTETVRAWGLFTRHVPTLELAKYAHGLPTTGIDCGSLERHLNLCGSCRQELEGIRSDRIVPVTAGQARAADPVPPRGRRSGAARRRASWRVLAVAASLGAVLLGGGLLRVLHEPDRGASPDIGRVSSIDFESSHDASRTPPRLVEARLFTDGFESGSVVSWSGAARLTPEIPIERHREFR